MRVLLDTNILIDHLASRQPYVSSIRNLIVASYFNDVELWVSVQSYLDALHSLRRFAPEEELRATAKASLDVFHPCGVMADDLAVALDSKWPDVEDYVIARCAEHIAADYILTRDVAGFEHSRVPAITASQLVQLLNEQGYSYQELFF